MTRKKVKLAWIANDNARKASLKKRRLGLLKKVSELTTLCGTQACVIIYSPDESEPMVWPSHAEVQRQLEEFQKMPELERLKKMMNQETYVRERVTKAQEQLRKFQGRNKEVEMGNLMLQIDQGKGLNELSLSEVHGLTWFVEEKMKEIRKRIEFFLHVPFPTPAGNPHGDDLPLPSQGSAVDARIGSNGAGFGGDHGNTTTESLLWDQWFIDMINNNELKTAASCSSIRGDMGLPGQPFVGIAADQDMRLLGHSFGGSSSVVADMGQSQYGNFRGLITDTGLPPLGFRPHVGASDMGLTNGSVGGSSFGPFGSDIGLGLNPFQHIRNSSTGREMELLVPFGGASNSGAGGEIGRLFDGKTWPNNFSHER